jgi:hypothetical protein
MRHTPKGHCSFTTQHRYRIFREEDRTYSQAFVHDVSRCGVIGEDNVAAAGLQGSVRAEAVLPAKQDVVFGGCIPLEASPRGRVGGVNFIGRQCIRAHCCANCSASGHTVTLAMLAMYGSYADLLEHCPQGTALPASSFCPPKIMYAAEVSSRCVWCQVVAGGH